MIAPTFEELLKGLVIAFVFLISRKNFDSLVDGIVYATVVSLAFAGSENVLYFFRGYLSGGITEVANLFIVRVVLGFGAHAIFTSFFGGGLALSRNSKNVFIRFFVPLFGLGLAMISHSVHNTVIHLPIGRELNLVYVTDFIGLCVIVGALWWGVASEKSWIQQELLEEAESGLITRAQYLRASSSWDRTWQALTSANPKKVHNFYQLLTKLAFTKYQKRETGESNQRVQNVLRGQIRALQMYRP